ncbi:MAG TPA: hypothetical protein VFI22_12750 [Thermomicrobiales bacterium]|nr:hypothetical protein [Thermomicrobiales bacterium]
MEFGRAPETDSGWVGAGPDDDLDERLAAEDAAGFDLAAPHVMTALGPIDPDALGVTLISAHLERRAAEPNEDRADDVLDRHATLAALEAAFAAGVRTMLDLGVVAGGLDVPAIAWLAARAPMHLVAAAPVAPGLARNAAADRLIADLREGIAGAAIRAGAILLRHDRDNPTPGAAVEAAAAAQRRTGAPLFVSGDAEEMIVAIARLGDAGVGPNRVIAFASAGKTSAQAIEMALTAGSFVALVDLFVPRVDETAKRAAFVAALAAAGHGDRILLGAGPDWSGMLERFPLLLMDAGLDAIAVRTMLVDNPRRALTIEPPVEGEEIA